MSRAAQSEPEESDMPETADSPGTAAPPVAELTYEQAREQLVAIVQQLESGGAPLDESLRLWERGERLAARCEEILTGAAERVAAARAKDEAEPPPTS